MSEARVLVTGATGFIGRWTVDPLLRAGVEVHAVTRRRPDGARADVTWHEADLHDHAATAALLARVRPSHLLHLAWYVTPGLYLTSLENLGWVGTTIGLLEAFATAGGRRVVVAGTSAEYDPAGGLCVEERTPIAPSTLYAACKRGVYDVLRGWSAQVGVTFGWGRIFFLHGPGEAAGRLVPQLVRAGLSGAPFPLRYPAQVRDYLHVADTAGALVALLLSDVQDAVNIASGEPVALADLARHVERCLERPVTLLPGEPVADPVPTLVGDTTRLRADVGFVSRYTLSEGLRDTVEWWKARKDLVLI